MLKNIWINRWNKMKYTGRKYSKEELLEMYEALAEARIFNVTDERSCK